ncbi:MAG: hypothetical protein ACREBR_00105, partial [bacterium]
IEIEVTDGLGNVMSRPDGKPMKEKKHVYALVLSTPSMLNFLKGLHESGKPFPIAVDGTYRLLENGWTVVSMSTHSVVYNEGKYTHQCLPICFMVTHTECHASYEYFFDVAFNLPNTHFGQGIDHRDTLLISHINQDRASYIRSAARVALGTAFIGLTCNVHIKRKFGDKSNKKLSKAINEEEVLSCIRCMCYAMGKKMFDMLAKFFLQYWSDVLKEEAWAKSFQNFYLKNSWDCWYTSASQKPGIVPWNQIVENYNYSQIKAILTKGQLRQPMGIFLNCCLPLILTTASVKVEEFLSQCIIALLAKEMGQ